MLRKGVLLCDTYIPHRRLPLGYTSRERPHVSRKHPYRPNPTQRQILHKGCRKRPPPSPSLPPFPRTQPASGGSVRARFGPTPSCAPAACEPGGRPSTEPASCSIGAARCAATSSSRFRSSRATVLRATSGSAPLDTNPSTSAARFRSWNSWSRCALRCCRLLSAGDGGVSPTFPCVVRGEGV